MISYVPLKIDYESDKPPKVIDLIKENRPVMVDVVSRRFLLFPHLPMPSAWASCLKSDFTKGYNEAVFLSRNDEGGSGSRSSAGLKPQEATTFDSFRIGVRWEPLLDEALKNKDREVYSGLRAKIRKSWGILLEQTFREHKGDGYVVPVRFEGDLVSLDDTNLWIYLVNTLQKIRKESDTLRRGEVALFVQPHMDCGGMIPFFKGKNVKLRERDTQTDMALVKQFKNMSRGYRVIRIGDEKEEFGKKRRIVEPREWMDEIVYGANGEHKIKFNYLFRLEDIFDRGFVF